MKTLYLDCSMGAAGDMLTACLLGIAGDSYLDKLNSMGVPGVEFKLEKISKCGITGNHVSVLVNGQEEGTHLHSHKHDEHSHSHSHSNLSGIAHIVNDHLNVSPTVKKNVMEIYNIIASAESQVHGVPVEQIHFHEVGNMDAVADITAVCFLMEELGIDDVIASPVNVGSGTVKCAHGILPVPAPATALILKDIPVYSNEIKSELCTPTGAALLKFFVSKFCPMPLLTITKIGYGMGKKDFDQANCIRGILGETDAGRDKICKLSCNLDDMSAEQIGFAMDRILEAGALDVYTIPVGMKKQRPGVILECLVKDTDKERLVVEIFKNTSTAGIRQQQMERYVLDRSIESVETEFGTVRRKNYSGYGVKRSKWEYEDLAEAAKNSGKSIQEIINSLPCK